MAASAVSTDPAAAEPAPAEPAAPAAAPDVDATAPDADAAERAKRRATCGVIAAMLCASSVMIGYHVHGLGWEVLLDPSQKQLRVSDAAADALVANHTFLHVGGPHRGGTTVLWRRSARTRRSRASPTRPAPTSPRASSCSRSTRPSASATSSRPRE